MANDTDGTGAGSDFREVRHSRRRFLGAAALGTTALAVSAIGPGVQQRDKGVDSQDELGDMLLDVSGTPVLAYVRDAAKGELVLLIGTTEVVHRDRRLASRLVALAKGGGGDVVAS